MSRFAIALFCAIFVLQAPGPVPPVPVQVQIFQYFMAKAQNGNANAEYIVGTLYEAGKGVPKNEPEAKKWYQKAATQGNQLAKDKLDHSSHAAREAAKAKVMAAENTVRERAEAAARQRAAQEARARVKAELAARARLDAERAARAQAEEARAAEQRAAAARKAQAERMAQRRIDALPIVLSGGWFNNVNAASMLPSPNTSCLQAGNAKIVCFSQRLHADVNGSALTYTVKSTASNFGPQGTFTVHYLYHVLDVSGDGSDAPNGGIVADPPAAQLGWQSPGHTLQCQARNTQVVACTDERHQMIEFARR